MNSFTSHCIDSGRIMTFMSRLFLLSQSKTSHTYAAFCQGVVLPGQVKLMSWTECHLGNGCFDWVLILPHTVLSGGCL